MFNWLAFSFKKNNIEAMFCNTAHTTNSFKSSKIQKHEYETKRLKSFFLGKSKTIYIIMAIVLFVWRRQEFDDTKGVIRIRISKKYINHNGQQKKYKRTNNDLQNIHIKQKIE